jgi:predicted O-linked N-acetylglucosamine transferase (SPINDLY family)
VVDIEELFPRAVAAHQSGNFDTAEPIYRQILTAEPNHAAALTNLGVLLARKGQFAEAAELYEAALAANPKLADAHFNLGNLHRRCGNLPKAVASFETVLRLVPNHTQACTNLGLVVSEAGNWQLAAECFRRAVAHNPDVHEGFNLLWDALSHLGQFDEAERAIREFIARAPDDPRGRVHLGLTLTSLDRAEEAVVELESVLQQNPDYAEAHNALGLALDTLGRTDEANNHYREAIRLRPEYADALSNLGLSLSDQGQVRDAVETLTTALSIRPNALLGSNRLVLLIPASSVSPQRLRVEHENWVAKYAARFLPAGDAVRYPDPGSRLRIGYVFADLRTRVASAFVETLLTRHDRTKLHVTCYPSITRTSDETERLRRAADAWLPLSRLSDDAAAEAIRADGIDILVDLCGHTAGNRLLVFARKPARVQVSLFGYPCTTGLKAIDFRISDSFADPPGISDTFSTEKILRIPNVGRLYIPPPNAPTPNALPAGSHRTFTFGCLNASGKLSDACLGTWANVLRAVPKSRLVLQAGRSVEATRQLTDRFTRFGISSDRLELVYRLPEHEYPEAYQPLDMALDPFPFNGRATTCDALWMGVPVLTVAGADCRARQGLSILANIGLTDFVANSIDKFVELAATWASQRDALADLRSSLREMVAASPVTDAEAYVRNLEDAYRKVVS